MMALAAGSRGEVPHRREKRGGWGEAPRPGTRRIASAAQDRLAERAAQADPARLDPVAADDIEQGALGLGGLGLAEDVEDIVGPDRLPVAAADVHAHEDVTFLDGGFGRRAARRDGLDIEPTAELGRDP